MRYRIYDAIPRLIDNILSICYNKYAMIDNIISKYKLPSEIQRSLSSSFRTARKARKHGRREASIRSGVPEATIRRFEDSGEISLRQLLMLCDVYGNPGAAGMLFPKPEPQSMDELIAMSNKQ